VSPHRAAAAAPDLAPGRASGGRRQPMAGAAARGWKTPESVLVVGFAVTGRAVTARLRSLGCAVTAIDDRPPSRSQAVAASLGASFVGAPTADEAARLAAASDLVVVSPGVPASHPAIAAARRDALVSEIELAWQLSDAPIAAVTGTNGKTTVTTWLAEMLQASGVDAVAAGNIGTPLIEAVPGPGLDESTRRHPPAVVLAEVSSFQLSLTRRFRPTVAVYLNLAADHLDWHSTMEDYAAAKAKIFANQTADDVAVANACDAAVMRAAGAGRARVVTFGLGQGDYHQEGERLVTPAGETIVTVGEMARTYPHDRANTLAAAAAAMALGATVEGCHRAATSLKGLAHRLELVAEVGAVRFYDDSKATTPSAVCAALDGFSSVVLIAGGRNKGLDLSTIAAHARSLAPRLSLRGVVAIGEASRDVIDAFAALAPVCEAASMGAAVQAAAGMARAGDAVLLSPGCASFDWYGSYAERGDEFAAVVRELASRERPKP
jgi:UDP-N-acetylmuramoylalanine--D-glutamate ligase